MQNAVALKLIGDPSQSEGRFRQRGPRIALLTPYNGGNLGDAAIQDALIANLRLRLPDVQFSGISLDNSKFFERHGVASFPIRGSAIDANSFQPKTAGTKGQEGFGGNAGKRIRAGLRSIPLLGNTLRTLYGWWNELRHCFRAYNFLKQQDLLIVSGGGQLCDHWGGAWRHPFALFKWAWLARMAQVPFVVASVGASGGASITSRLLMAAALRTARYRSFRDPNTREMASNLLPRVARDPIVPDLAFSLQPSQLPRPAHDIQTRAQGRTIVAVSVMAYAKPGRWPQENRELYQRYLAQMRDVIARLLDQGYFVVMVWSSCGDDESVVPELLESLDPESKKKLVRQLHVPAIAAWKDLVSALLVVDFVIASRLHSTILSFICQKPVIAVSFDPKVDWLMKDLGQDGYILQISDFQAEQVIALVNPLKSHKDSTIEQVKSYQREVESALERQYETLAQLSLVSHASRK